MNQMLHGRSNHIITKFHFMRNQVHNGMLEVVYCSTQKQLTDVLTKAIKTEHFIHLRNVIDVVDYSSEYGLRYGLEV